MRPVVVMAAAVFLAACSLLLPEQTRYLRQAQDHATAQEVQAHLGRPKLVTATAAGDPVWVYQIHEVEAGSQNSWSSFGSWCDEYVLTFDRQHVLRAWTHKSQRHGGERMPTYCVPGGYPSSW
jgi:hypothetical protein